MVRPDEAGRQTKEVAPLSVSIFNLASTEGSTGLYTGARDSEERSIGIPFYKGIHPAI